MDNSPGKRMERYTIECPQEVLLVSAEIDGEPDLIAIFKGYSSSLMRPTAFDPDVPMLPAEANIISIDRVAGPYNPDNPHYLEQGLTWSKMQVLLEKFGV